jgi:putative membrane-bound dehydrogenase-like protein
MKRFISLILPVAAIVFTLASRADEPTITAKDLPRMPLVPPQDAVKTIVVKKGFQVVLAASEPNVYSPVAMAFDERGRLFVVEMIDYSERRDVTPHLGRIRMLEDTKGNGIYDQSTIYADNLAWPTAVFPWNGGIFVGATPDIIYFKDTKGDGKADLRETVFTGFASESKRINVQEMLNSFIWGLDNRIHGTSSGEGGLIKSLRHPDAKLIDLHNRDFAIDPRTMTMTSEAGGGQHGLTFDDYGRRFTCNNSDHIRMFMYDDRYAGRNPYYAMPPALASIAVDGPAAEVYRISPEEPWRVIRTRWRVASLATGPVEGGGRSSGYFTGASGITIYRGSAFPKEFLDNAFVGEVAGNLVNRMVLYPYDIGLEAQRAADEQKVEFLASTDTWFRPVQFANAPDGTLYVIDMHREIVEHPWSLPEGIKKFLDLNSGDNCGRIFRVEPDGFKMPKPPHLDRDTTAELVATLENPNGWHRDTAQRLLYERQDQSAVPALIKLLMKSKSPLARIHALYALDGLDALDKAHLIDALNDPEPWVRVHAIKLAEKFDLNAVVATPLLNKLLEMASDNSNLVRYQLAFTLGEISDPRRIKALGEIARTDEESSWIQAAILSSLATGAGELFADVSTDANFVVDDPGREFLRQLVSIIGAENKPADVAEVLDFIGKQEEAEIKFILVRALGEGLKRAGTTLQAVAGDRMNGIFAQAAQVAANEKAEDDTRNEAIELLGSASYEQASRPLFGLLKEDEAEAVQLAAIGTLGHFPEPAIAGELLRAWPDFSPRVRSQALSVLLGRPERAKILLEAIEAGDLESSDLTTAQLKFLRNHPNPEVRELALKVLGEPEVSERQKVVDAFQPALNLTGNAAEGRKIFLARCTPCHRLSGAGYAVGPDLVSVKSNGKAKILISILDPSREVAPQYIAFDIETKDGESSVGIIASETSSSVTVRQPYGHDEVIMRSNIKGMKSQQQSLMPEGLEQGLSQQDFANLLEFITTADSGQPKK